MRFLSFISLVLLVVAFAFFSGAALSQNTLTPTTSAPKLTLSEKETVITGKYEQLETILLRMAELNATTNPRRAALLKKVIAESKDRLITLRLEELVAILQRNRLSQAVETQIGLEKDLDVLLKLLESENREKIRNAEKEKIKEVLREIEELILQQRSLKGRTPDAKDTNPLSKEQEKLREKVKELSQKMGDLQDVGPPQEDREEDKENESGKDSPSDKSDSPSKQNADKNGESSDDASSAEEDQEKISPTQRAMRQAQQRMKRAREQLEKAEKKGAVEDQEEAIAELQIARAELERLLRQMREEEMMQTLQFLDARLKKMLQIEKAIRSQTAQLDVQLKMINAQNGDNKDNNKDNEEKEATALEQPSIAKSQQEGSERQIRILAGRLGVDQSKVIEDADAAILLLREDGTARAMCESLEQTRFDMLEVEQRLHRADIGQITQSVEDTIIESLQEMIDAVAQAKKDAQDRENQRQQNQQPGGQEEDQCLIGLLSELRMIRTMQRRINERTERYEKLLAERIDEGETDLSDLEKGVTELTRQQRHIQLILRDVSLGKYQ